MAAVRNQQQMQPNDLMDDSELMSDDRELDNDLSGKRIGVMGMPCFDDGRCLFRSC